MDDNDPITPSICLAMIIGKDTHTLERSLVSARDVIRSFAFLDVGFPENAKSLIDNIFDAGNGLVIDSNSIPAEDYTDYLYQSASALSDYVLFMEPGETVSCINTPSKFAEGNIIFTEVELGKCSFMEPRIIRTGLDLTIPFPFLPAQIPEYNSTPPIADHLRIKKYFGPAADSGNMTHGIRYEPNVSRDSGMSNPGACLQNAITCTRLNDLKGALRWLESGLDYNPDRETRWLLHYLLGVARAEKGDTDIAVNEFSLSWDLDPERLEPLHQIIKITITQDELAKALELSCLSLEVGFPLTKGYFERATYEWDRYIQHLFLLEKLGKYEELIRTCESFLYHRNLSVALKNEVRNVKARYSNRQYFPGNKSDKESEVIAGNQPVLTIGMATIDDYDGVYFSLMSILLYHQNDPDEIEFIVIDNNPGSASGRSINNLCKVLDVRYIPVSDYQSTAVRDSIFRYATGKFVLCMDSHVMLLPGATGALLHYIEENPHSTDLLQGPLVNDRRDKIFTHLAPEWQNGMYGVWTETEGVSADTPPFEIGLQGLGVFCCRRTAWPGLNPRLTGFGAEEGYLHEKFRRSGGSVTCLPFLRWIHRFQRPQGIPYEMDWKARIRNYLVAFDELGWDFASLSTHFSDMIGFRIMSSAYSEFVRERKSPFYRFDGIYWINSDSSNQLSDEMIQRFSDLGIYQRIRRTELIHTNSAKLLEPVLSDMLVSAKKHAYKWLLVFNGQPLIANDIELLLDHVIYKLEEMNWKFCLLDFNSSSRTAISSDTSNPVLRKYCNEHTHYHSIYSLLGSSTSFLVNLESGIDSLLAPKRGKLTRREVSDPTQTSHDKSEPLSAGVYIADPPATIHRDRFQSEEHPLRFCFV